MVDRDGYAVGVIRARVTGDAGIGFAIPINQAKDFLESRGLDSLMPARRFRLGALQSFEEKGIALRLPEGVGDTSPFRSRVESDPGLDRRCTANRSRRLAVDRQADRANAWSGPMHSSASRSRRARARLSRERRRSALDRPRDGDKCRQRADVRMQYGILDLGARSSLRGTSGQQSSWRTTRACCASSLSSLDGQRLMQRRCQSRWIARVVAATASGADELPLPAGWVVEPGAPSPCAGLPQRERGRGGLSGTRHHACTSCGCLGRGADVARGGRRRLFITPRVQRRASYASVGVARRVVLDRRRIRAAWSPAGRQLEVISPERKGAVRARCSPRGSRTAKGP